LGKKEGTFRVLYLRQDIKIRKTCQKFKTITRNGAMLLGRTLDITPPSGRYIRYHIAPLYTKKTPVMAVFAIL
jgi:hypothetical protein